MIASNVDSMVNGVADPLKEGEQIDLIMLRRGGVATSGRDYRKWRQDGVWKHHIIDPRTGTPAVTPWRTVSVAAASCVDANTASTAAVVLGEAAPEWLAARRLPARLVREAGQVVRVAGWPEETE